MKPDEDSEALEFAQAFANKDKFAKFKAKAKKYTEDQVKEQEELPDSDELKSFADPEANNPPKKTIAKLKKVQKNEG